MDKHKIQALISLLDDPNDEVFATVESELLKEEVSIIPDLEKAWEGSLDIVMQERLEGIIHTIQLRDIRQSLITWIEGEKRDLLTGAYIVCKYQFPEVSLQLMREKLAQIKKDIWLELNEHLTSLEKIRIVNHVFFDVHQFGRNTNRLMAPENNYISEVLQTKKGNPIALSVIYSLVCNELGLPVFGVNLPKNFIVAFLDETAVRDEGSIRDSTSVLFYINPINKGAVLGKREIEYFIKQQKLELKEDYFLPCDNADIVRRLFANLANAYQAKGDVHKENEIQGFIDLLDGYIHH